MAVPRLVVLVLVVLGVLGIAAGVVYFAEPAKSLPSVLPGHITGSTAHRTLRGIAAVVIGLVLLALAGAASVSRRRHP
jgi:uncharacterized membrane protein HdeD (DUF308 family)